MSVLVVGVVVSVFAIVLGAALGCCGYILLFVITSK